MQFIPLVRELKLFDHLQNLEELIQEDKDLTKKLQSFFAELVDRMFIDREIERVLDANFLKVITDIDTLVQDEYVSCTGKQPELSVFDRDRTGDEIGESLEKEEAIAEHFMKEYRKRPSRELADAFRKQHEIPTFEKVSAVEGTNLFNDDQHDMDGLFSSFPVEMMD